MTVGAAEHETDLVVTIDFPIRPQASFDRIHPALRQMANCRQQFDLTLHAERATIACSAAFPAHPAFSIFFGSVLFISARRQIRYFKVTSIPKIHIAPVRNSATDYTMG
ncbi:hypothetical protein [Burkholderia pseudomultivorans]|uniref:hypothetical protein n=1 Tax=Burkholderia pseudomultivorans TaxID=1207504 RepID=UPI0018C7B310|nr:hypothetical protein [Burkholderia pseudomultivorans]